MTHEFWYLSRAAGFTAYLLLFASVTLGIATSTRLGRRIMAQNATFDIHRFLSLLALAFTLFHVYVLLGDGYFNYNVWQLSAPFLSPYRTWQIAVGTFALYSLILIVLSFYVRKWIGYRSWRALHFLTFALYAGATLHGITAGTDTTQPWAQGIYLVTGGIVLALIAYRLQHRIPRDIFGQRLRYAGAGLAIVTAIVLTFGTGLLRHQGTSNAAVETTSAPAQTGAAQTNGGSTPSLTFAPSFDTQISGTYTQNQDGTSSHLVMQGTATGNVTAGVKIELATKITATAPNDEGGEQQADDESAEVRRVQTVTQNDVQLLDPSSSAVVCNGQLSTFDDGYARMSCDGTGALSGVHVTMQGRFSASRDGTFSGALSGEMSRS